MYPELELVGAMDEIVIGIILSDTFVISLNPTAFIFQDTAPVNVLENTVPTALYAIALLADRG